MGISRSTHIFNSLSTSITLFLGAYPYSEMSNRDVKDQIDAGYRLPKSRDTPPNIYQVVFLMVFLLFV